MNVWKTMAAAILKQLVKTLTAVSHARVILVTLVTAKHVQVTYILAFNSYYIKRQH